MPPRGVKPDVIADVERLDDEHADAMASNINEAECIWVDYIHGQLTAGLPPPKNVDRLISEYVDRLRYSQK
jgi:hypothetical protein